jgi:hypothetical protein
MAAPKCDPRIIQEYTREAKKKNYNTDRVREVQRRVKHLAERAEKWRGVLRDGVDFRKAQAQAKFDHLRQQEMGELHNMFGEKYNKVDDILANSFAQKSRKFGLGLKETATGAVREDMLQSRRFAQAFIDEIVFSSANKKVKEHKKLLDYMFNKVKMTDPNRKAWVMAQSIEVGTYPKANAVYELTPVGQRALKDSYNDYLKQMREWGFEQADIDKLTDSALKYSGAFEEVREAANVFGADIGSVQGIEYFRRLFEPDVQRWIEKAQNRGHRIDELKGISGVTAYKASINESRKTFKYLPEDEFLTSELLGIGTDELNDLIRNGDFVKYLHEQVPKDTLDQLVDLGVLAKIPMTTVETWEYLVRQYEDLPFAGMADIFKTDPQAVFDYTVKNLKRSAEQSVVTKRFVSDGIQKGWVVDAAPKNLQGLPLEQHRQYIEKLRSEGWEKIESGTLQRFAPDVEDFGEFMVHPSVFNTWKAVQDISRDPVMMGSWGSILNNLVRLPVQQMLLSPAYAARIFVDSTIQYMSSGGNFVRMMEGYSDVMKYHDEGLAAFDDTAKVYLGINGGKVTKRQFVKEYMQRSAHGVAPGTAGISASMPNPEMIQKAFKEFNIMNFKGGQKGMNYAINYFKTYGAEEGINYIMRGIKGKQDALFEPIAATAHFAEAGARLGAALSLADTSFGNKIGQFASSVSLPPRFNNSEEVFRHLDDYFYAWDNVGTAEKTLSNYVMPFMSFVMKNPPAQIRQLLRRPHQWVNYWRLHSYFVNNSDADHPDLNEATLPRYITDGLPRYIQRLGGNKFAVYLPGSTDARADMWGTVEKTRKAVARDFGWWAGTTEEQRDKIWADLKGEGSETSKLLVEMTERLHPIYRVLLANGLGVDPDTGKKLDEGILQERDDNFLGINMHPALEYTLKSMSPVLQRLDKANPMVGGRHLFGTPEIRDPYDPSKVLVEGQNGWWGAGGRRHDYDDTKYLPIESNQKDVIDFLKSLTGASVQIVDVGRNLQWTYSEAEYRTNSMYSALSRANKEITLEYIEGKDDAEFKRRVEAHNEMALKWAHMRLDLMRIDLMAQEKGMLPQDWWEDRRMDAVGEHIDAGGYAPTDEAMDELLNELSELMISDEVVE